MALNHSVTKCISKWILTNSSVVDWIDPKANWRCQNDDCTRYGGAEMKLTPIFQSWKRYEIKFLFNKLMDVVLRISFNVKMNIKSIVRSSWGWWHCFICNEKKIVQSLYCLCNYKLGTDKKIKYLECDQVERNEEYQSSEQILRYHCLSCNSTEFH